MALEYVYNTLKSDEEIVLEAVKGNSDAFFYANHFLFMETLTP
jgi:hypothetical protein